MGNIHISLTLTDEQVATIMDALKLATTQEDNKKLAFESQDVLRHLEHRVATVHARQSQVDVDDEHEERAAEPHRVIERERGRETVAVIDPAAMVSNMGRSVLNWLEGRNRKP
jgi:hypothetical protein